MRRILRLSALLGLIYWVSSIMGSMDCYVWIAKLLESLWE
jgi:hypothetical protein